MHIVRVKLIYLRLTPAFRTYNSVRINNSLRNTVINSSRHGRRLSPMLLAICGIVACLFLCMYPHTER